MFSLNTKLLISLILVSMLFLSIIFFLLLLDGLATAFGTPDKSRFQIVLPLLPFILGSLFVIHTLYVAKKQLKSISDSGKTIQE